MSEEVFAEIQKELDENTMVLFMKGTPEMPQCGFSAATVEILKQYGKPFKGICVLSNPQFRAGLPQYSNWPTFPQLFIKGKLIGGCDIVHELRDSGELQKMVEEAFAA